VRYADGRIYVASERAGERAMQSVSRFIYNAYWHKTMGLKGFRDPYRRFRAC